jgi:glycosyltransferase involved in cell wall biosynthesis
VSERPRAVVGHPRRHHLYEVAQAYEEVGALHRFVTERYFPSRRVLNLLAPAMHLWPRLRRLREYSRDTLTARVVIARPEGWSSRGLKLLGGHVSGKSWQATVLQQAREADIVHLPCCHALEVFQELKGQGKTLILEQYTGNRREGRAALLREAAALGAPDITVDAQGYDLGRIEMNEAEYALADKIVSGSEFVRATLVRAGVPEHKLVLAEYGCDVDGWPYFERHRDDGAVLQVGMVGSGAIRKGVVRMLRAARRVKGVRVHVFGSVSDLPGGTAAWTDVGVFHGHVPRADLVRLLRSCHAFALPSVWEGSAYAIGEAMALGLPVVVSRNSGSWARHEIDGWVVGVGDEDALADALERLKDEPRRKQMAQRARENAELHTWAHYRESLRSGCLPSLEQSS